jgi:predicted dehydrogenase
MPVQPLRAVLIGAGGFGGQILSALCQSPLAEVVGLADQDPAVAASAAAAANCPAYADSRRLLAETKPQVAFLALPPAAAVELAPLVFGHRLHVWAEAPFARNLDEAVAGVRLAEQAGVKLAVGAPRRFMEGYRRARQWREKLGKVYLARAHYFFDWGANLGWHGDRSAGGGTLAEQGYHILDLLLWLLGVPEAVHCVAATGLRAAGQYGQGLYDSDDAATLVLRYGPKAAAAVSLCRCFNPVSEGVTLYGEGGSLSAGTDACVLRDRDGNVLANAALDEPPERVFNRQIDAFLLAAASGQPAYAGSGREALLTMAALEAGYLSNRTGQAESPALLLGSFHVQPAECLRFALPPPG